MNKRVIIAGGSGFVGKRLQEKLVEKNYDVVVLTRRNMDHQNRSNISFVKWDGKTPDGWQDQIEDSYGIINLAGDNIAAGRWTEAKKKSVIDSRVQSTQAVVKAIKNASTPPSVLVQASATGFYGDRGDEILDESSQIGTGFLSETAKQWESQVLPMQESNTRCAIGRIGVVLGMGGGMMDKVVTPFKFYMGGHLGSGQQWLSWIHIEDLVDAIIYLLENDSTTGTYNLTSPNPCNYKTFFQTLGKVMKSPSWFHAPGFILKTLLGEMAKEMLLGGNRVLPKRLLESGFEFKYPDVEAALKNLLK